MTNGPNNDDLRGANDFVDFWRNRFSTSENDDQERPEPDAPDAATDHSQGYGPPPASDPAASGAEQFAAMVRGAIH